MSYFIVFFCFHFIYGMYEYESKIYTSSRILANESNNDLDFLAYLYSLCENQSEDIIIDKIDYNESVVKKFFAPYLKEFKDHKYCFRRCEGEKELTKESQQFEGIPSGQYVIDTQKGNIDNVKSYKIILPDKEKDVFICDALVLRNQNIEFFLAANNEMSEGSFVVLKCDPYNFDHKNCKKNLCSNLDSLCRQISQGSSVKFIIEQAKSLYLGSFTDHPYCEFFKENETRTKNNDLLKKFFLNKDLIIHTWKKHLMNKPKKISNNFLKNSLGLYVISSGLYLKYNKKHSYKNKILIIVAEASLLVGGLFLYDNYKRKKMSIK